MQSAAVIGSSPLTRGKPGVRPHCQRRGRLIPAHAGKTMGSSPNRCSSGAHPRSRGENNRIACGLLTICGSSPLTRGKLPDSEGWTPIIRLIPAHAGKTSASRRPASFGWAHPRSRGENRLPGERRRMSYGSSPLTRGKRQSPASEADLMGLIPAHAGKTVPREPTRRPCAAHPRSRGENLSLRIGNSVIDGSSPLTRGKLVLVGEFVELHGLIPAHAGKTQRVAASLQGPGAHPRSRGENG